MFGLPSPALYVGTGLLALLVASGGINACQYRINGKLRADLGTATAHLETVTTANESQSKAIGKLEKAARDWEAQCTIAADTRALAAQAVKFRETVERQSRQLAEVRSHETPACQSLLAADFGAVCPGLSLGLRELAEDR